MLIVRINLRNVLSCGIAMGVVSFALAAIAEDTTPAVRQDMAYRQVIGEGILARTLDVSRIPDAGIEVETWQMLVAAHRPSEDDGRLYQAELFWRCCRAVAWYWSTTSPERSSSVRLSPSTRARKFLLTIGRVRCRWSGALPSSGF